MDPIARMMKRYIKSPLKYALPLLFICALVIVSISGCTSSTSPTAMPTAQKVTVAPAAVVATPEPTVATPEPTVATPEPTVVPSKPSAAGFVLVEVNSITTSSQLGSYPLGSTPSPGKTYVVFDVTLTNQNKNNLYMGNYLYFKLTTADGTVYAYSPSSYWLTNGFKTGVFNTNPGDKVTGQVAFEIPQSAKVTKLSYGDLINGVVTVNL